MNPSPPLRAARLASQGVSDLVFKDNSASFIFKGNINAILKTIAELDLVNASITEPDLEEIFLHYYAKED